MKKKDELPDHLKRKEGVGQGEANEIAPARMIAMERMSYKSKRPKFSGGKSGGKDVDEEGVPLWLITFTDVIALMLTFFVLLYSMATPSQKRFEELTSTFTKQFGHFLSRESSSGPQDVVEINKIDLSNALDLNYLHALLEEKMRDKEQFKDVLILKQKRRLIISLPSELLFEGGKAEISAPGRRAIFALGSILSKIRNGIEVIGHSDPRPITGENRTYESNWHLSLARAADVARWLESVGYRRPITVRGLSSSRYDALPEDIPEEERLGYSRRVDIVILQSDGSQRNLLSLDPLDK